MPDVNALILFINAHPTALLCLTVRECHYTLAPFRYRFRNCFHPGNSLKRLPSFSPWYHRHSTCHPDNVTQRITPRIFRKTTGVQDQEHSDMPHNSPIYTRHKFQVHRDFFHTAFHLRR
ncbi:hypothetical protein M378DRAFT_164229 [Amanita muscaria Koide BX008]|uniref:Uncharacterized protein n=1 Tax=Amanita muscaria (strain Koide BX008) TaxID=946122 RepID=A0A0C2SKK9_AMAMK|nr:hypothetical protein M378DRAFT_164229 [Amanita muscaria Koide BX008]